MNYIQACWSHFVKINKQINETSMTKTIPILKLKIKVQSSGFSTLNNS